MNLQFPCSSTLHVPFQKGWCSGHAMLVPLHFDHLLQQVSMSQLPELAQPQLMPSMRSRGVSLQQKSEIEAVNKRRSLRPMPSLNVGLTDMRRSGMRFESCTPPWHRSGRGIWDTVANPLTSLARPFAMLLGKLKASIWTTTGATTFRGMMLPNTLIPPWWWIPPGSCVATKLVWWSVLWWSSTSSKLVTPEVLRLMVRIGMEGHGRTWLGFDMKSIWD